MNIKMKHCDQIDQQILNLLIENSRISYSEIADRTGLSRMAIKNRIEAMEQAGVIEQYTVIINPEKIGRNASVFFDIEADPEHLNAIIEELNREDAVTDVYLMTGSTHLHVHAVLSMDDSLESFLLQRIYRLPGIRSVKSDLIVSRLKTRKGIRV